MQRPSAERTRSRRWRSGTRHNKKRPVTQIPGCPMPHVCLVHRRPIGPRHPAMAMRLTRCEQRWVDDVRSGRVHVHLGQVLPAWQSELLLLRQRINTSRMKASGIINEASSPTGRIVGAGMDHGYPGVISYHTVHPESSPDYSKQRANQIASNRKMDISDRWYPRD